MYRESTAPDLPQSTIKTGKYQVEFVGKRIVSLWIITDYNFREAAHPSNAIRVINFDLLDHRNLLMRDLVIEGSNYQSQVIDFCDKQYPIFPLNVNTQSWKEEIAADYWPADGSYPIFSILDNGIKFHLTSRIMTGTMYGYYRNPDINTSCLVPYDVLRPMMKPDAPAAARVRCNNEFIEELL